MSDLRATIWRPLIRRKRLERYLREQAEDLRIQGAYEAGFSLFQLAENLRMGVSIGLPIEQWHRWVGSGSTE